MYKQNNKFLLCIDFSKAFDVVSHDKLFARLYSYGIRGSALLWLRQELVLLCPMLRTY